nr:hypothetical protein [Cressdnaviricota sp.]
MERGAPLPLPKRRATQSQDALFEKDPLIALFLGLSVLKDIKHILHTLDSVGEQVVNLGGFRTISVQRTIRGFIIKIH